MTKLNDCLEYAKIAVRVHKAEALGEEAQDFDLAAE